MMDMNIIRDIQVGVSRMWGPKTCDVKQHEKENMAIIHVRISSYIKGRLSTYELELTKELW